MPSLLFDEPVFRVKPRPSKIDFDPDVAQEKAQLQEDAVNHLAQKGITNFGDEVELAILDAFFRFGILETGFTADYIQNPDAGLPFRS